MIFDRLALSSMQQEPSIQQLVKLDNEAKRAKGRDQKAKESQAESERNRILHSCDPHSCYHKLKVLRKDSADALRSAWVGRNISVSLPSPELEIWKKINFPLLDPSLLPDYSFAIQFKFKLAKPYISRDEREFYIIDNPVHRDKVFNLPYVAPSSWKGALRSTLWQLGYSEENGQIQRLFGNERMAEDETKLRKGRLRFYSTFFTEKSLEVINPHDRRSRVGQRPIYFESVPIGAEGAFSLFYIPFDLVGQDKLETEHQATVDLKLTCKGLHAMFTVCGFGAKTSSGFGTGENTLSESGRIIVNSAGLKNRPYSFLTFDELIDTSNSLTSALNEEGAYE